MNEWINVENRFPEDNECVIVWDGNDMFFARFKEKKDGRLKKRQGYFEPCECEYLEKTTYWMPLPKPPEVKDET